MTSQYDELISWADFYDHASFEAKKMIANYMIKKVEVFWDYTPSKTIKIAEHYKEPEYTKSRVSPTSCVAQAVTTYEDLIATDGTAAGWWWLRSPGRLSKGSFVCQ